MTPKWNFGKCSTLGKCTILDLFGSPKFWTISFLHYFLALPIIGNSNYGKIRIGKSVLGNPIMGKSVQEKKSKTSDILWESVQLWGVPLWGVPLWGHALYSTKKTFLAKTPFSAKHLGKNIFTRNRSLLFFLHFFCQFFQ